MDTQLKIRLPSEVKQWLEQQVTENRSSQSSEVVRAVRERMRRVEALRAQMQKE